MWEIILRLILLSLILLLFCVSEFHVYIHTHARIYIHILTGFSSVEFRLPAILKKIHSSVSNSLYKMHSYCMYDISYSLNYKIPLIKNVENRSSFYFVE